MSDYPHGDPYHVCITLRVGVTFRRGRYYATVLHHTCGEKPRFKWVAPACKCGKPCQLYGGIGGFSKSCAECNAKNALRHRLARKRKA